MNRLRDLIVALLIGALVFLALLALDTSAAPATTAPKPALRIGFQGQRVKDLQWLLSGHKPSVYAKTVKTYQGKIDGEFGPQTQRAVRDMKWRLGFPKKYVNGRAGRQLFEFLLGKRQRPKEWIGAASARVGRAGGFQATIPKTSSCGAAIARLARGELGVHEIPDGSNDGPRVRVYQRVTGAFGCPGAHDCNFGQWCASFAQWNRMVSGAGVIPAKWPAHVFTIVNYAHDHALLHAQAKVGAVVAYLRSLGHMGIVERVTKDGFFAIEGNYGNRVARVFHRVGEQRTVFIWPPALCSPHTHH